MIYIFEILLIEKCDLYFYLFLCWRKEQQQPQPIRLQPGRSPWFLPRHLGLEILRLFLWIPGGTGAATHSGGVALWFSDILLQLLLSNDTVSLQDAGIHQSDPNCCFPSLLPAASQWAKLKGYFFFDVHKSLIKVLGLGYYVQLVK